MKDEIQGWVTTVIDGTTFEMEVTHVAAHNRFRYFPQERVRLTVPPGAARSRSAKERLRRLLEGMAVICRVDERDRTGSVLVEVAMASYLPSPVF
jgi:endonuclease YncB( thermonuclease family)